MKTTGLNTARFDRLRSLMASRAPISCPDDFRVVCACKAELEPVTGPLPKVIDVLELWTGAHTGPGHKVEFKPGRLAGGGRRDGPGCGRLLQSPGMPVYACGHMFSDGIVLCPGCAIVLPPTAEVKSVAGPPLREILEASGITFTAEALGDLDALEREAKK